jgi:hypothetical protein
MRQGGAGRGVTGGGWYVGSKPEAVFTDAMFVIYEP